MNAPIRLSREGNVAIVALEDRESKNSFSRPFVEGIERVFREIAASADLRAVVVHGYDNYFCCGGTKDELIGLSKSVSNEGATAPISLDDLMFFDLFLRCEVPVIAAMQGHAIGGGLALGCFADIVVIGEECIYNAIFMKYGFTPGMGATYIVPKRMGSTLGAEMLFTARNYRGLELKARGAHVHVVKKADVIRHAMDAAQELATKPAQSLKSLKRHLTGPMKADLATAIAGERAMHEQSFAHPEVRARIERFF